MTYYNEHTIIWHNGQFVKAAEAKTDFYSQSLHYGYSVFEGIRSYRTINGETKIFRAADHYERLKNSADAINMPYHWTATELIEATYELLRLNNIQDAYIRPVVYAPANMSFAPNKESYIFIAVWEMAPFLGEKLLRIMTSSFQRPNPGAFKIHAKAAGHYVNSVIASQEAKAKGYDEALLLDMHGFVAEGPGANVFIEKDGKFFTPPPGHILPGITRATVLALSHYYDIPVEEKLFTIKEINEADGAFFCGTAAEVIGWQSLDGIPFRKNWNDTRGALIQQVYKNLVIEKPIEESLLHHSE